MNLYAVIDIGSNTIRLSVCDIDDNLKEVRHNKITAGLAKYIVNGKMTKDGINAAVDAILKHKEIIDEMGLLRVYPFATAAIRNASNAEDIKQAIYDRTGYEIDIISGPYEAECDFFGAMYTSDIENGVISDIGGGSTELITFKAREIINGNSLQLGSLNLYNEYVCGMFPTAHEKSQIKAAVLAQLEGLGYEKCTLKTLLGIGGTIRSTAKLYKHFLPDEEINGVLKAEKITRIIEKLGKNDEKALKIIQKTVPDRLCNIIPGMVVLETIIEYFGIENIILSNAGVREGYLLHVLHRL